MTVLFFLSFPAEIIEAVIDWMDDPDDLRSLACTSKAFYSLVVPRHTDARILRLPLFARCAWSVLVNDPRLARNIRSFNIVSSFEVDEKHFPRTLFPVFDHDCWHCTPRSRGTPVDVAYWDVLQRENEILLMGAITNMSGLTSFSWKDGFASVVRAKSEPSGRDVWTALAVCRNVTELIVHEPPGAYTCTGLWETAVRAVVTTGGNLVC
ncbi:hypothetical protein FA95DRAFT_204696 [Auriscalpium vulgare]|uniref:Uncharacterized protein n=1 Tax=Auriscalpium vulgare TaxID=40419 RepID=A0ACB8RLY6_9AGAM|nr:hypothetical protein FA95DRAFT_204696 [Auriscalpium vulgare]